MPFAGSAAQRAPHGDERQQQEDRGVERRRRRGAAAAPARRWRPRGRSPSIGSVMSREHVAEAREVPEERPVVGDAPDASVGDRRRCGRPPGRSPRPGSRRGRFRPPRGRRRCGPGRRSAPGWERSGRSEANARPRRGERRALDDDRGQVAAFGVCVGGHEDVRDAVLDAELLERLARGDHVAARAVRRLLEVELAELHGHDAVVGQVLERLLDHLRRVEVALGEHERAGRRRVVRRVAVGRDVPDEVVVVVAAREVRAAVALVEVDLGPVGEVAGVVGELVGEQVDGHRVQLDGVDVRRAKYSEARISLPPAEPMISSRPGGSPRTPNGIERGRPRSGRASTASPSNCQMPEPNVPSWHEQAVVGRPGRLR